MTQAKMSEHDWLILHHVTCNINHTHQCICAAGRIAVCL